MKRKQVDEVLLQAVAQRLREIRKARGITQEAAIMDTEYEVGRIETKKMNLTINTIANLCRYYGISLKDFFDGMEI